MPFIRTVTGGGYDLLSGDHNFGTLRVEDRELVIEYAKLFSESLRAKICVMGEVERAAQVNESGEGKDSGQSIKTIPTGVKR
jgi:hypothetical protein